MPVLFFDKDDQPGHSKNKKHRHTKDSLLPFLWQKIHAEESKSDRMIVTNCDMRILRQLPRTWRFGGDLVEAAFRLSEATKEFVERARRFYYAVALSGHACPACGDQLEMTGESRCSCRSCANELDPTEAFQRCNDCGGLPRLRVRRYVCQDCGRDVQSRFVFDGLVFDANYYRQKMTEHRRGKRERLERVRQMLAGSRSPALQPEALDLSNVPGLLAALSAMSGDSLNIATHEVRVRFDLKGYQAHIQAHIQPIALTLDELPPLNNDFRLDRIGRFIAIIFLAHAGLIEAWQDGPDVMVKQRETD